MASRCIFFQRGGAREHVREKISSFSRLHVCVFLSWCMYVSSLFKEAHHLPNIFSLTYVRSDVSRIRVDTVRAGPVPVRAGVWTGRRRSGPNWTEQCLGPVCRDRTGNGGPRAGPRGPSGPAKTWAERALELRRELFIGDAMLEEAQLVEKMSGSFRRTRESYMMKKNTGGSS